jgi:hypothetical protein
MNAIEKYCEHAPDELRERLFDSYVAEYDRVMQQRTPHQLALNLTRETAASHEAAHAVLFAAYNDPLKYVRVMRVNEQQYGMPIWLGVTMPLNGGYFWLGPSTSEQTYLFHARSTIAGLCGEALRRYDLVGSSVDEIIVSQFLAQQIAVLRGDRKATPEHLEHAARIWQQEVWQVTLATMRINEEPHARLTSALMREQRIDRARLKALLRDVHPIDRIEAAVAQARAAA